MSKLLRKGKEVQEWEESATVKTLFFKISTYFMYVCILCMYSPSDMENYRRMLSRDVGSEQDQSDHCDENRLEGDRDQNRKSC